MTDLPSSIEAYLLDADFNQTEITILKKLLEEDALTMRELAAKTGKSTGVLDMAVKKLIKKGILAKEIINDAPKYILKSMNSVLAWMEEDMKAKQAMMMRRHENFETFLRTVIENPNARKRPDMEFFEGSDGLKKAYMQLLQRGNDIAQYGPTRFFLEEDPLRDFRVLWFRERQRRGIFSRVMTHDTVYGRRFQSRDPFEYRKTVLVDSDAYPFTFERIIIGDTVACFQVEDERACFIKYPELAEEERVFFDRLWNKKIQQRYPVPEDQAHAQGGDDAMEIVPAAVTVPLRTQTFSSIRAFLLGRRSVAVLCSLGLLAGLITYSLYLQEVRLNTKRVQEKALSIAATGALQFEVKDLNQLRTVEDITKAEYAKVIYQLNLIRNQNPGIKYVYIMRPTEDPNTLEFVADADSIDPFAKKDLNSDGDINDQDALSSPGETYDISSFDAMKRSIAGQAAADSHPITDKWGTFLSGFGPIKDENGNTVAILGIDIEASTVRYLSQNTYTMLATFLVLFLIFVFIRLAAFNRSLLQEILEMLEQRKIFINVISGAVTTVLLTVVFYQYSARMLSTNSTYVSKAIIFLPFTLYFLIISLCFLFWMPGIKTSLLYELWKKCKNRKFLTTVVFSLMGLYWLGFAGYFYTQHLIRQETGKRLIAIAATAASQINPDDLENLRFAKDMKSPEYQRVFELLNDVRRENRDIVYVYILRPTETEGIWEFVVDADANYYVPFDEWDYTNDEIINEADENVAPGVRFDLAFSMPIMNSKGLLEPVFDDSLISNQWGAGLSSSAPIFDSNGNSIAILAIDIENKNDPELYGQ